MAAPWQPTASVPTLKLRASILAQIRHFFAAREVLEVQVPVLGRHTVTEPHIESIAVPGYGYLQTSPEYHMKRLLAAGVPSIYSLGPVFRAGEAGSRHNPEFTMLEWYRVGWDDAALRAEVAALVATILGPQAEETITYAQLMRKAPQDEEPDLVLAERLEALAAQGQRRVFVTDYPAQQAALARLRPDDPTVAARFEFVVNGLELANGYYEFTEAAGLRARFEADQRRRAESGALEVAIDEPFLAAHEAGLPECAGVALGVDRLVMLAAGAQRIEQVLTFPGSRA